MGKELVKIAKWSSNTKVWRSVIVEKEIVVSCYVVGASLMRLYFHFLKQKRYK